MSGKDACNVSLTSSSPGWRSKGAKGSKRKAKIISTIFGQVLG